MTNKFNKYIKKLYNSSYIDPTLIDTFVKRGLKGKLTREENPEEHFCSFFIPFDKNINKVFLGHHIIADDWIPPGGHIEKGELPNQTVLREFKEELHFDIKNHNITLYNISIIPVRKSIRPCKIHFDFWHIVDIPQTKFIFDTKEFYDANWFTLSNALRIMKREEYKKIIKTVFNKN